MHKFYINFSNTRQKRNKKFMIDIINKIYIILYSLSLQYNNKKLINIYIIRAQKKRSIKNEK